MENHTVSSSRRRSFLVSVFLFVGIIIFIILIWFVWSQYLSPPAHYTREAEKNYATYETWEDEYKKTLTEDIYGGSTPEETLELFIAAIENGDVDLASKYFIVDTDLSRQKWIDWLTEIKDSGNLEKFAADLKKAEIGNSITPGEDVGYVLRNDNGTVGFGFRLKKINNPTAVIWKIIEM